jgi:hypothetical protein
LTFYPERVKILIVPSDLLRDPILGGMALKKLMKRNLIVAAVVVWAATVAVFSYFEWFAKKPAPTADVRYSYGQRVP